MVDEKICYSLLKWSSKCLFLCTRHNKCEIMQLFVLNLQGLVLKDVFPLLTKIPCPPFQITYVFLDNSNKVLLE